jgi:hypothetical protein
VIEMTVFSHRKLPRSAIFPGHIALGLFVSNYLFFLYIPLDLTSEPEPMFPRWQAIMEL